MWTSYFFCKCLISGLLVGLISEISRRNPGFGALIASLPLTSILAFIWMYKESQTVETIIALSDGITLIVLPSVIFFILLSNLLKQGWPFYGALCMAGFGLLVIYWIYVKILTLFGFKL
jgi:hypothetical protein